MKYGSNKHCCVVLDFDWIRVVHSELFPILSNSGTEWFSWCLVLLMILQMSADGQFTVLPLKVIMCYTSCELAVWLECDERDKVELEPKKFNFLWFMTENCVNPSKSHKTTNVLNTDEKGGISRCFICDYYPGKFAVLLSSSRLCQPDQHALRCRSRCALYCGLQQGSCNSTQPPVSAIKVMAASFIYCSYKELINLAALIIIIKIGLQGYVSSPSLIYSCNFSKKYAVILLFPQQARFTLEDSCHFAVRGVKINVCVPWISRCRKSKWNYGIHVIKWNLQYNVECHGICGDVKQ